MSLSPNGVRNIAMATAGTSPVVQCFHAKSGEHQVFVEAWNLFRHMSWVDGEKRCYFFAEPHYRHQHDWHGCLFPVALGLFSVIGDRARFPVSHNVT